MPALHHPEYLQDLFGDLHAARHARDHEQETQGAAGGTVEDVVRERVPRLPRLLKDHERAEDDAHENDLHGHFALARLRLQQYLQQPGLGCRRSLVVAHEPAVERRHPEVLLHAVAHESENNARDIVSSVLDM